MEGADQRTSSAFGSPGATRITPSRLNPINQMGIPPFYPNNNNDINNNLPSSLNHYHQNLALQPSRLRALNLSPLNLSHRTGSSSHTLSLPQPSFFSLDSLPPLSPSTYQLSAPIPFVESGSANVSMERSSGNVTSVLVNRGHAVQLGNSRPPRKGHRRSSSDSPLGISDYIQSTPQFVSPAAWNDCDNSVSRGESLGFEKRPAQLVLKVSNQDSDHLDGYSGEKGKVRKEESVDDIFSAYMNLDNINNMGLSIENKDSKTSGTKIVESNDNEVEICAHGKTTGALGGNSNGKEGVKRCSNGDIASGSRHRRSFSLDSSTGNFSIEDGSPKFPPLQNRFGQYLTSNPIERKTCESIFKFGNVEFSSEELNKIKENDKLAEIAMSDPKRAKRVLANRLSAARSKERKTQYITDLELKVQTLQTETTTLSTEFNKLQMDTAELKSQNNEYKFRLQALEQQSQLKDTLKETLERELQRLRRTVDDLGGESLLSARMAQQVAINQQMSQLQHQQPANQVIQFQQQNRHSHQETRSQPQPRPQPQKTQRNNELQSQQ